MSDDRLVRYLAALAVTLALRAGDANEAVDESSALAELRQIDADGDTLVRAAEAVGRLPTPPDEPADKAARLEFFQKMVGATTATDDLEAQLRARQWLQLLAAERSV